MRKTAGLAALLLLAATAAARAQSNPQQLLAQAKDVLDKVSISGADENSTNWVSILKRDFADLQSSYAQTASDSTASSPVEHMLKDWHYRYAEVGSDMVS